MNNKNIKYGMKHVQNEKLYQIEVVDLIESRDYIKEIECSLGKNGCI